MVIIFNLDIFTKDSNRYEHHIVLYCEFLFYLSFLVFYFLHITYSRARTFAEIRYCNGCWVILQCNSGANILFLVLNYILSLLQTRAVSCGCSSKSVKNTTYSHLLLTVHESYPCVVACANIEMHRLLLHLSLNDGSIIATMSFASCTAHIHQHTPDSWSLFQNHQNLRQPERFPNIILSDV